MNAIQLVLEIKF